MDGTKSFPHFPQPSCSESSLRYSAFAARGAIICIWGCSGTRFHSLLRGEDQWIDLETCKELLRTRITAADLKGTLDMKRQDPERRRKAREQYAPMWDALTTSLIEEEQSLSQEKPN